MIGINYGDAFPWESIPVGCGEKVFMVDFSLQQYPEMRKLAIHADPLIWIDHHKSAIEEHNKWLKSGNESIDGIQESGQGSCILVYKYLWPDKCIPTFVRLLGEYDVWDLSDSRTLSFQLGMRTFSNTHPDNLDLWHALFDVEQVHAITEIRPRLLNKAQRNKNTIHLYSSKLSGLES